jgi:nucleoside-triphosphatase THEP1
MSLIFLTGDKKSGKTSWLGSKFMHKTDADGVISPDIGVIRFFQLLKSGMYLPFSRPAAGVDSISIGMYTFAKQSFEIAARHAASSLQTNTWTIIDEWGPLELDRQGFYPLLYEPLQTAATDDDRRVIIVVRPSLLELVLDSFELRNDKVTIWTFPEIHSFGIH